jgi:hypothetical protein
MKCAIVLVLYLHCLLFGGVLAPWVETHFSIMPLLGKRFSCNKPAPAQHTDNTLANTLEYPFFLLLPLTILELVVSPQYQHMGLVSATQQIQEAIWFKLQLHSWKILPMDMLPTLGRQV